MRKLLTHIVTIPITTARRNPTGHRLPSLEVMALKEKSEGARESDHRPQDSYTCMRTYTHSPCREGCPSGTTPAASCQPPWDLKGMSCRSGGSLRCRWGRPPMVPPPGAWSDARVFPGVKNTHTHKYIYTKGWAEKNIDTHVRQLESKGTKDLRGNHTPIWISCVDINQNSDKDINYKGAGI